MAKRTVADVVLLSDSDDEDIGVVRRGGGGGAFRRRSASLMENRQVPSTIADTTVTRRETLECRSFWKAGDNFVIPKAVTPTAPGMLEHARVHPKFLHSNATSHKWAFGAIAELLDNAVDEIQNGATYVKIDKIDIAKDNSPALIFQDDGAGMDPDGIRKCMSLGYSSKKSNTTIGQYGNGFKTSTMRLGADAIVFTRSTRGGKSTQSIGLLSYTFLRRTGQDDVIVPMIDIDISSDLPQPIIYGTSEDWFANLDILLKWSPFSTEDELLQQFEDIGTHGTKVMIYNLWLNDEGVYELSFDDEDEDIRLRDENALVRKGVVAVTLELRSHISYRFRHSLKAYISMLYLKKFKNFKIILRGIPVEQFNIADELRYPETIMYKPHAAAVEYAVTEIKVGFVKEAPKLPVCGFNVYHKNRLIMPFWRVTLSGSTSGNGVVGVLEANFIEPAHDKQDFERSSLFQRLEARLQYPCLIILPFFFIMEKNRKCCSEAVGYHPDSRAHKSKRKATPDQPPGDDTFNPPPLPSDKISQGGPKIREISLSKGTSSREHKSKRTKTPDQPPGDDTFNPPPLPSDKISQGGLIIREISLSKGTSSRTVALPPPHMRNFTGVRSNFQPVQPNPQPVQLNLQPVQLNPQPVQLNPQPAATESGDNLGGETAYKLSEENIQLFMECEEYAKKETEMEQTVRNLEKELEEAKIRHHAVLFYFYFNSIESNDAELNSFVASSSEMSTNAKTVVAADVVHLVSDDEDDVGGGGGGGGRGLSLIETPQVPSTTANAAVAPLETLECRSFWKAGESYVTPNVVSQAAPGMLEHARVHPKFLHSNATSHKWAFGAIAELLDNAVDEIQNGATFVKIDKIDIAKNNSPALVFQDDGAGMDPNGIRKCMSLGYSSKKSNTTIGQYGNGFKTSTMRLGADAIVFSRSTRSGKATQSVGLLSYTFLRRTGQDDVIVPMIDIDISKERPQPIIYGSSEDWSTNLDILLKWSPFSTKDELLQQFDDIGTHGTKIIIYNLWLNDEGIYELSFDDDDEDIRLRDESVHDGKRVHAKELERRSHISYHLRYSLRAYTSMLYLEKFKNFKIILRGIPVKQFNIADEFRYPEIIKYRPQIATIEQATTEIKVGFIKEAPKLPVCGYNVYHKNRLIRPFWKVTMDGSALGNGVVGVLEANFIEPAHDKQDFERSSLFQRLEARLKKIVYDYWSSHSHVFGYRTPQMPADKSKRIPIPDQPPPVNTFNPFPSPSSQGGPIIREINISNATSVRTVAAPPPHMRNSTGVRNNFQPVQLTPQPAVTDTRNKHVGKSVEEISQENIQLFMKCEEYVKKETEMEQTVRNLEKELEEAKSKCAQLAMLVDAKKKEMQQV
uniref:Morc S5 domain-containing protein n=2 Tax=Brassica oleracea var. oleracea TaxID=109376 RepID=A0A0D3A1J6_BRAOL